MRKITLVAFALGFSGICATAAPVHFRPRPVPVIPDAATARYAHYSERLTATGRSRVVQLSAQLAKGALDPSQFPGIVQAECLADMSGCNGGSDIEALVFIVMMQAAKSAQQDLKAIMDGIKQTNAQKDQQRAANAALNRTSAQQLNADATAINDKLDSLSDLSETEQLRLQMAMDRYQKVMEMLSNVLKKVADTDKNLISNMK